MAAVRVIRFFRRLLDVDDSARAPGKTIQVDVDGITHVYVDPTGGVTDHGALTGLADNDHPQYQFAATAATDAELAAAVAGLQPLDTDLTAIAALATTAFGRGLLILANQAALLSEAGAAAASHAHAGEDVTSGTVADARIASTLTRDTELTAAIAAHEAAGDPHPAYTTAAELAAFAQPVDSDLTAIAALATTAFGRSVLELANAAALRTLAGLVIGTDIPSLAAFNDHSARHENGGADEMSLAGLDGISVELAAHIADATAAHAASAIAVTPFATIAATTVQAALEEIVAEAVSDLGPAVILAPASSARNVIQPISGDVIAAIVKAHAAQSVDLTQWQKSDGAVLAKISELGVLTLTPDSGGVGLTVIPADYYDEFDPVDRAGIGLAFPGDTGPAFQLFAALASGTYDPGTYPANRVMGAFNLYSQNTDAPGATTAFIGLDGNGALTIAPYNYADVPAIRVYDNVGNYTFKVTSKGAVAIQPVDGSVPPFVVGIGAGNPYVWWVAEGGHEVLGALAAIADGDVENSSRAQWFDDSVGAPALRFKMRDSAGTLVAGISASQAYVDAHVNDASDVHEASAISFSPTGTVAATDVQAAIAEVASEASAGGISPTLFDANTILKADTDDTPAALTMGASTILARLAAGNIKAATPAELKTLLAIAASGVSFSPTGTIAATDVQAAIAEVASEAGGGPAGLAVYGDGSDGAVTIASGTTTLTRDMFYDTLTVQSGGILKCNGYKVCVKTLCTVDAGGTIHNNGGDAAENTGGTGTSTTGTIGNGAAGVNGSAAGGQAGNGVGQAFGGAAGAGGSGTTGAGGAAGSLTLSAKGFPRAVPLAALGLYYDRSVGLAYAQGGPSGGTGGSDVSAIGGASGAGGGSLVLCAKSLVNNGTISCKGGAGGSRSSGSNCGGGGGGGGGLLILIYGSTSGSGTTSVAGGAAGIGRSTGTNGAAGSAGTLIALVN